MANTLLSYLFYLGQSNWFRFHRLLKGKGVQQSQSRPIFRYRHLRRTGNLPAAIVFSRTGRGVGIGCAFVQYALWKGAVRRQVPGPVWQLCTADSTYFTGMHAFTARHACQITSRSINTRRYPSTPLVHSFSPAIPSASIATEIKNADYYSIL